MRRYALLLLVVLVLAVGIGPVTAQPAPTGEDLTILVPSSIHVDGDLDLVVLTGAPESMIWVPSWTGGCFGSEGYYEVRKIALRDSTHGTFGAVDVVVSKPLGAGTRLTDMLFDGSCCCTLDPVQGYKIYIGVTE